MMTAIKPEEILPKDFDKLNEANTRAMIILQALISVLMEKNIITVEEINERAKQLYEVQREMLIAELNNA